MNRFVVRTVRDGRVRIAGCDYAPSERHVKYDGRLDGMRYAFGRYPESVHAVGLWGTEAAFLATRRNASTEDQERYERGEFDGPEIVDGKLPWMFWQEAAA